ncbi:M48 family metallopeptidase [Hufsiella ginkgonis]|uniref:M48 family metalloprotease n=1 Tax=Hufsiella ginkgonis TaxID=2695274 RepID=A0A7K1XZ55_9SPHI|nr:M48 family metallopeptidase [Hufsiella ginkgonis]MXV15836.1 M48 family metalloprotease [Hufsiella ginkgonis]
MKQLKFLFTTIAILVLAACATVPLTGRKKLSLVDEASIQTEAATAYKQFLSDPKTKVIANSTDAQRVKRVGTAIAGAISRYMQANGYGTQYNYNWEFNLVESKDINAWCMPGGKVAVYTGILPVTQSDAGLATVMGHEIAHAIAGHSSERASQTALAQAGGSVIGAATGSQTVAQLYGVGGQLTLLKYGRNQESEADRLGLIFMAMAGYDPQAAVSFWQRMATASQNGGTPEFLSTHPSDATRIADIQKRLPEAMKYYKK